MLKITLSSLLLAVLLMGAWPHHTQAQDFLYGDDEEDEGDDEDKPPAINQYSSKYKKNVGPGKSQSLLPQGYFLINFVRPAEAGPQDATLRFSGPVSLNGCVVITPPVVETQENGTMLRIKVTDPVAGVDRSVRYAHYDCKTGTNAAYADVTLNRDALIADGVNQIAFQSGAATDYYAVQVNQDEISLVPKSTRAFRPRTIPGKIDGLRYKFYPENTVMLYVPGAESETGLEEYILPLARAKGLVEARTLNHNFEEPLPGDKAFYFIDQTGRWAQNLEYGSGSFFGRIEVPEEYAGSNGPYMQDKPLDIYAKLPGLLD